MEEYLSEAEIAKIEAFCQDEAMYDAVRKVMLACVYYSGTLVDKDKPLQARNQAFDLIDAVYKKGGDISNDLLGAGLRGLFEGVNLVEQGFAQLKTIQNEKGIPSPLGNEAI